MKGTVSLVRVYILFCNNKTFSAILCTCNNSATSFKVFRPCHSLLAAQTPCSKRSSAHKYLDPNLYTDNLTIMLFAFEGLSFLGGLRFDLRILGRMSRMQIVRLGLGRWIGLPVELF